MKTVVFRDRATVTVIAGNGGDGIATFRREKYVPHGGPDGGDGGRGGHVILQASKDVDSLLPLYFQPHQKAEHGGRGGTKQSHGRNGADRIVPVPCGTTIYRKDTGDLVGEVLEDGQQLKVARGGIGGKGNCHYKTSSHQAPTEFTEGTPGQEIILQMELKMVADVGLVGYPNAGKSTLLRALTHAHPKVASYPFTTLNPIIGTLQYPDFQQVKIADIPGLIDGAHDGVGLGFDFLRHIERTQFLVFVIDMAGTDGRVPWEDFQHLREELHAYQDDLDDRPYIVVANKMDDPTAEDNLATFREKTGEDPLPTIAELKEGVDPIREALQHLRHPPG